MMRLCAALFPLSISGNEMVADWTVTVKDDGSSSGKYKVAFEWEHKHEEAVVVDYQGDGGKVLVPSDDPRCDGASTERSAVDNQPFWMPRMIPRPVPAKVTEITGIRFASMDWQPCGHKDITICHAESHYDIHFYYVSEDALNQQPMCEIGSASNPDLPICRDSATNVANHDYFKLLNRTIPTSMKSTKIVSGERKQVRHDADFCVDPSSAILRSGVHYGDADDTLSEWKKPVTIIGSHDCELKFFEPMVSWKWISNNIRDSTWPTHKTNGIRYADKSAFPAIPEGWDITVSEGCQTENVFDTTTDGECHIRMTIEGDICPDPDACNPVGKKQCGNMKDCLTGEMYVSPYAEPAPTPAPTPAPAEDGCRSKNAQKWSDQKCRKKCEKDNKDACKNNCDKRCEGCKCQEADPEPEPESEPEPEPEAVCEDDADWYKGTNAKKNCQWVAKKAGTRCKGNAAVKCGKTCSTCGRRLRERASVLV